MADVGIRALQQNASAVVAQAAAGEVITITERGRPVARLVPVRRSRLDELVEAGLATPAKGSLADLPPSPPGAAREPSAVGGPRRDARRGAVVR